MSRGPSSKAVEAALPIALARGFVTLCKRERGSVCDFTIHEPGNSAIVLAVPSRRLHGTIAEMENQFAERLARLRLVPRDPCRTLEFWVCSRYGRFRFFRITETGLVEFGNDCAPPPEPAPEFPGGGP